MDCSIARGRGAAIVLSAGLAIAAAAQGQSPLEEPFPAVFELRDLLPAMGGDGSLGSVVEGNIPDGYLGRAVAGAGDINGDGLADIVVGAPYADAGADLIGQAYVIFGSRTGFPAVFSPAVLTGGNGFRVNAADGGDRIGNAMDHAGDVNGDGIDDVIIGASLADPDGLNHGGIACVVFGRDTSAGGAFPADVEVVDLNGTNGFAFYGSEEDGWCGIDVAGIGDFNGDGLDDIAIGAHLVGATGSGLRGEAYVVFGRTTGFPPVIRPADLDGTNGFVVRASGPGRLGQALARLGDVNGDGLRDLAIGSPFTTPPGGVYQEGVVHVLYGREAVSPFPALLLQHEIVPPIGFTMQGDAPGLRAGVQLGDGGDVNADGINDIIVGVGSASPGGRSGAGSTFVVFGRSAASPFPAALPLGSLDGITGFRIDGVNPSDRAGLSASAGGDANGDGIDDILIGAFGLSPAGRAGAGGAYLVFGSTRPFAPVLPLAGLTPEQGVRFNGIDSADVTGRGTDIVGDVNGDGVADLLLGAERAWPGGRREAGEAYLVYGRGGSDPCPVDLDGDGALTIFDYLVFQGYFALGDPKADFDGDGSLTIFDFLAYQNAFDLGCP